MHARTHSTNHKQSYQPHNYRWRPRFRLSQQKPPHLSVGFGKANFYHFCIQHNSVCKLWRHTNAATVTVAKFIFELKLRKSVLCVAVWIVEGGVDSDVYRTRRRRLLYSRATSSRGRDFCTWFTKPGCSISIQFAPLAKTQVAFCRTKISAFQTMFCVTAEKLY